MKEPQLQKLFRTLRDDGKPSAPWTSGAPVAVYGAGGFGQSIVQAIHERGFNVAFMVDRAATDGQHWRGVPVLRPESVSTAVWSSTTVLVGIHNYAVPVAPIRSELVKLGCKTVLSPIDVLGHLGPSFGHRYWLTTPSYYEQAEEAVGAARQTLEAESRPLFDAVVTQRLTGDYERLPSPSHGLHDYTPQELGSLESPVRLVDGGAFDGDTIRAMLQRFRIQAVAAFEPDPANFSKLSAWVHTQPGLDAMLWPCGLHSHSTQVRFAGGLGEASAMSAVGSTTVQCVALDEALPNFRPNVLKLDVEGAEPAALLGARETIRAHRPFISAGLYHHPAHLWQVPLLVKQLHGGYRLHLRLHAANGFDLRLYAVADSTSP